MVVEYALLLLLVCANVEYQRGDAKALALARLSKSIQFDPPPSPHLVHNATYANLGRRNVFI
jgi:hypothetical protein